MTEKVLGRFDTTGNRPAIDDSGSLGQLLDASAKGDYLAIMAYVHQTPEVDRALDSLRRKITNKCGIAVTVGYGPRFLHSTGQLHKGGPGPASSCNSPRTITRTWPSRGPTTPLASWLTPKRQETWRRCWLPTAAPPASPWAPTRPPAYGLSRL